MVGITNKGQRSWSSDADWREERDDADLWLWWHFVKERKGLDLIRNSSVCLSPEKQKTKPPVCNHWLRNHINCCSLFIGMLSIVEYQPGLASEESEYMWSFQIMLHISSHFTGKRLGPEYPAHSWLNERLDPRYLLSSI